MNIQNGEENLPLYTLKTTEKILQKDVLLFWGFWKKPKVATNIEDEYAIHWAGVGYTAQTTGAEPVDIGPETRRLDVVFTHAGQNINGCWIAMPLALSGSLRRNQAYLPPDEYEVEIKVKCENGKGDKAKFKITSPKNWEDLDFDKL